MLRYKPRFSRTNLDPQIKDVTTWATVDPSLLDEEQAVRYINLEEAVSDYLSDIQVDKICKEKDITKQGLIRLVKRCLIPHPDGRIWGFRALISNTRQKMYERTAKSNKKTNFTHGGDSGELIRIFDRFPEIKDKIDNFYLKRFEKDVVHEARIPYKSIHKRFIDICREVGITYNEYPFTTANRGYVALWKYLKKLAAQEQNRATRTRYGKDNARKLKSQGESESEKEEVVRPYQRVEFDAHLLDVFCTLKIPSIFGGYVERVLDRIWLLLIIDVFSRAVIGYHLCFKKQYSANDVLLCVKNAIIPWKEKQLTIPDLTYHKEGGFPSGVFKELEWALWDELAYDNAKANLAQQVRERLTSVVNCAINAGPVGTPERRPFIERFFNTLEENGYHRLPSTTGSNPKDTRREDPEGKALELQISLEHIEELTDVMIANYNGEAHSGIGYRSPLEMLNFYINSENILPRQIPKNRRNNLKLLDVKLVRDVRGKTEKGILPHINYMGARYRNDILSHSPDLVGKKLTLIIDPTNIQSIIAILPNGAELGILSAQGPWRRSPHSLDMREDILKLKNKKRVSYTDFDDAVHVYMDYLGKESFRSKAARRKLASARQSQKAVKAAKNNKSVSSTKPKKQSKIESKKINSDKSETKSKKSLPRLKTFTY